MWKRKFSGKTLAGKIILSLVAFFLLLAGLALIDTAFVRGDYFQGMIHRKAYVPETSSFVDRGGGFVGVASGKERYLVEIKTETAFIRLDVTPDEFFELDIGQAVTLVIERGRFSDSIYGMKIKA